MSLRLGGIETGGTTFKLSLAIDHPTNVIEQVTIPTSTTNPQSTLDQCITIIAAWNVDSVGIASFGPIDLTPGSKTYGYITTTPKPHWQNVNVVNYIHQGLITSSESTSLPSETPQEKSTRVEKVKKMKIGWNTDCNAAAVVEMLYGQEIATPVSSLVYITIGTGIGIGVALDITKDVGAGGNQVVKMVTNMLHPEAGHIIVKKHPEETLIKGQCPFHGDCLEGMANNHATAARSEDCKSESCLKSLPDTNPTWKLTSYYVAQLCINLIYTVSPEKIVIGGGLAQRGAVMDYIRHFVTELNNGYVKTPQLDDMDSYIVSSHFDREGSKTSPGAVGALWLGYEQLGK